MNTHTNFAVLRRYSRDNYWATRLFTELDFLQRVLNTEQKDDSVLLEIEKKIELDFSKQGALTKSAVEEIESVLEQYKSLCKDYSLLCVGHAHIDMNWLWGFHETVMITIDTFRTVLDLFNKYPQFKFSQSQASVYHIIEKYAPQLIEPIRLRIADGRWEVTATQWVESDMNLPSAESLVRQLSYAKRYMMDRFGVEESAFKQVFLPDTFGHGAFTPELFAAAGVQRLYHCRGSDDYHIYRWVAPSGRSILAYREGRWYNTEIDSTIAQFLPEYFSTTGIKTAFCLYGVGDHGGGPTMRDIERLMDMNTWPIFPRIKFSTLREGFDEIERAQPRLPEVQGERNPIFTGCYTSQSRIKMANRKSQELLYETEYFETLRYVKLGAPPFDRQFRNNLRDAWVQVLFGQFHDILPGSGIQLTREHALGRFQEIAAAGLSASSNYVRALTSLDTPEKEDGKDSVDLLSPAEFWGGGNTYHGAGVGFGVEALRLPAVGRGTEAERYYRIFNPLQWDRLEICEVTLWDWLDSPQTIRCIDEDSKELSVQIVEVGKDPYWGHRFIRLVLPLSIPAFGTRTLRIDSWENQNSSDSTLFPYGTDNWLVERNINPVLENDLIRVTFNLQTWTITSFIRKADGLELIPEDFGPGCEKYAGVFRFIREDAHGMTAWIVGRHTKEIPLIHNIRLTGSHIDAKALRQWLDFEIPISETTGSKAKVRISLDRFSESISYSVTCDWLERGNEAFGVPQLDFYVPLREPGSLVRTDVPFGVMDRGSLDMDMSALSFGARQCGSKGAVVSLVTDSKQAFRMTKEGISVILIRSSYDPDPYPELGRHTWRFSLGLLNPASWENPELLYKNALGYNHPSIVQAFAGKNGIYQKSLPFIRIEGEGVVVTAIKRLDSKRWDFEETKETRSLIIRVFEIQGQDTRVTITLPGESIIGCTLMDIHERPLQPQNEYSKDGYVIVPIPRQSIQTIQITLK